MDTITAIILGVLICIVCAPVIIWRIGRETEVAERRRSEQMGGEDGTGKQYRPIGPEDPPRR